MPILSHLEPTLPSTWYYDEAQYARELEAVWYRDWVCVGRLDQVPRAGDYFVVELGTQRLIVTRDERGRPRVFHNTCRHRGSALCSESRGRFRNGRIICPYHTWTYSLSGELIDTPARMPTDDFRLADYGLYSVATDTWGGFIFVNLSGTEAPPLESFLGDEAGELENWPLAEMVSVKTDRRQLQCNWKIFWENYSECYHCPRIHPELCRLVEIYGKGLIDYADDPEWQPSGENDDGRARVAPGRTTWSLDGQTDLPVMEGLDPGAREAGMRFASFTASMFVVAHPDYVRSVRMLPRGPESVELIIDWLLLPDVAESYGGELAKMLELGRLVVEQDGRACELNQQGLKSRPHEHGVLVPQEYYVAEFHRWLRNRLDTAFAEHSGNAGEG